MQKRQRDFDIYVNSKLGHISVKWKHVSTRDIYRLSDLSDDTIRDLALFGLRMRLSDYAVMGSPKYKRSRMRDMFQWLKTGIKPDPDLIKAVMNVTGKSRKAVKAFLDEKFTKYTIRELRKHPAIQTELTKIKAE